MTVEKEMLTVEETAKMLGIAPQTIYNHTSRRNREKLKNQFPIKYKKVGRAIRFPVKEVQRFINGE